MVVGLCSRGACSDEEFPVVPPSAQDCCFRNAAWRLSGKLLHFDEFGVGALAADEFCVRSFLGDAALFDDDDFIRVAYRAQTVGDDDGCAPFEQCVEGLLYEFFALGVEGGCRLVEDEDFGVFENGAGDAEALTESFAPRSPMFVSRP